MNRPRPVEIESGPFDPIQNSNCLPQATTERPRSPKGPVLADGWLLDPSGQARRWPSVLSSPFLLGAPASSLWPSPQLQPQPQPQPLPQCRSASSSTVQYRLLHDAAQVVQGSTGSVQARQLLNCAVQALHRRTPAHQLRNALRRLLYTCNSVQHSKGATWHAKCEAQVAKFVCLPGGP